MYTGFFPGEESGRGVVLTPHPLLVPWSKKSRAIPLLSLTAFVACKKGETHLPKMYSVKKHPFPKKLIKVTVEHNSLTTACL
jgi:hypothetical protein